MTTRKLSKKAQKAQARNHFTPTGVGVKHDTRPVSCLLPEWAEEYVRAKGRGNMSAWLRDVILAAIAQEQAE